MCYADVIQVWTATGGTSFEHIAHQVTIFTRRSPTSSRQCAWSTNSHAGCRAPVFYVRRSVRTNTSVNSFRSPGIKCSRRQLLGTPHLRSAHGAGAVCQGALSSHLLSTSLKDQGSDAEILVGCVIRNDNGLTESGGCRHTKV